MTPRLVSQRSPFIPITVLIGEKIERFEALLDTGFDGDIVVPEHFTADAGPPDEYRVFRLADGSQTVGEVYYARVQLGPLGTFPSTWWPSATNASSVCAFPTGLRSSSIMVGK